MSKKTYRQFNLVFIFVQVVLLIVGYLVDFFLFHEGRTYRLIVNLFLDTLFFQFFFVQYCSILLGMLTYKKGLLERTGFSSGVAVFISVGVMICSFILCLFSGVEGYGAGFFTYYVELISWVLLVVKAIVDGVKENKGYLTFNTVFIWIQVVLLLAGYICQTFFMEGKMAWLSPINNDYSYPNTLHVMKNSYAASTFILQVFFVQYCSILLGFLSRINKIKNKIMILDYIAVILSVVVLALSFFFYIMFAGLSRIPSSEEITFYTYVLEIVSLILLVVKTVVDTVRGVRYFKKGKKREAEHEG